MERKDLPSLYQEIAPKYTDQQLINKVGRIILLNAFNVNEIQEIHRLDPVSTEHLVKFEEDPRRYAPETGSIRLDTSASTAVAMMDSPWNHAVVQQLASNAVATLAQAQTFLTRFSRDNEVDWESLFRDRLYSIFLEIGRMPHLSPAAVEHRYKQKKCRTSLQSKFDARQRICVLKIQYARRQGDKKQLIFWTEALKSIVRLTVDGMSDEESDVIGEEDVKIVKSPEFRHPEFSSLFQYIDGIPHSDPQSNLFRNSGRKRLRRIYSFDTVTRRPPEDLPVSYYRLEYVEQLRRKVGPCVSVAWQSDLSIPDRSPLLVSSDLSLTPEIESPVAQAQKQPAQTNHHAEVSLVNMLENFLSLLPLILLSVVLFQLAMELSVAVAQNAKDIILNLVRSAIQSHSLVNMLQNLAGLLVLIPFAIVLFQLVTRFGVALTQDVKEMVYNLVQSVNQIYHQFYLSLGHSSADIATEDL
ncbi:hypothetical protein VKT23_019410 [Stygiomarasmius scandens]|uniref:Uncharacterized protein n=1 Tax=Marasmiellus scandens TaxID=2682957 RepID=A0ABR1INU5_9AGAR